MYFANDGLPTQLETYYTGYDESEDHFYQSVTFSHMRDYIQNGVDVFTHSPATIHRLSVVDMPLGDETFTGEIFAKYKPNYRIDSFEYAYRFYSQFDIPIPDCAFDGEWMLMKGISGEQLGRNNLISERNIDTFITNLAFLMFGGYSDYHQSNIYVDGDSHWFIEFGVYQMWESVYSSIKMIPYLFDQKFSIEYPYGVITGRIHDIAVFIEQLQENNELDVEPSQAITRNINTAKMYYPIGRRGVFDDSFDPWDTEQTELVDGWGFKTANNERDF